jgi:hypothetical protein
MPDEQPNADVQKVGSWASDVEAHLKSSNQERLMNVCGSCGLRYVRQSSQWGERCGECIAADIEFLLMGGTLPRARVPMKRASDLPDPVEREVVESPAPRRATGGQGG